MARKQRPEWDKPKWATAYDSGRRSEAARRGWETRWENGKDVGKKGKDFLERKYDIPEDWIEAPIFDDEWEIDY